ncbi:MULTISPECIES: integrase arm-type DNA-binding domain-containing protein [unclassified Lysobacter]|uniref:tyrosine-type recombinase/integrase n=1 Tax=unclassified Lysobacter TaxID=2635362 RepID=UPI0006FA7BF4|nr:MULTISPECIES: integrase arm-type DNA-binding domain-containing protein [unclassified Lysobacter]KQZ56448.1 integrase [Lysobacter sp. Root559]KRC35121.1 integrase [Lysobacter sp. Root76]KRD70809.1 integrase [Lysobacter sp. Root96]
MAANTGTLTAAAIKASKPGKLFDGGGLFLLTKESGARYWQMKYRHGGKERLLSFGVYPEVSLAEARRKRDAAREVIRDGKDPGALKRANKVAARVAAANSFLAVADAWMATQKRKLAPATFAKSQWLLDQVLPWLGSRPVAEIEPPELLAALKRIEARGAHETAHRTKEKCGQVFRYAIAHGLAKRDPSADLRGALAPIVRTSRAAITDPSKVGALLRALDGYGGQHVTRCALRIAPLLFVRPGELRAMEWAELDLDAAQWRIPAQRMKMREEHVVPLSSQALAILQELKPLTGRGRYVFPSLRTATAPMSENTVNAALRSLGYDKATMTGHGFRAMASTRLNELGWLPDVIERQLAHAERNKVRAAYNRAQYMAERVKMMQAWADYLDLLRVGAKVIPINRAAAGTQKPSR